MSLRHDSEDDIWEYKPLGKKKKTTQESPAAATTVTKRRCSSRFRKTSKRDPAPSAKSPGNGERVDAAENGALNTGNVNGPSRSESSATRETVQTGDAAEGQSPGDFCPVCQMPFSVLVVQSQRWHVAECLDVPRDTCKECPEGQRCSSTIPNHYKNFNHTLLAHSRANGDPALLGLSQQAESGRPPARIDNGGDSSDLGASWDSAASLSLSPVTATPSSKPRLGFLFLRSPGPEDLKKKKGWSSSPKGHRSISASQESKNNELSPTPAQGDRGKPAPERPPKPEPSLEKEDVGISYSPLSEFPSETKVDHTVCRKTLFRRDALEREDEATMLLFSDDFSSEDELLTQYIEHVEADLPSNTQLESITSSAPTNQQATSLVTETRANHRGEKEAGGQSACAASPRLTSVQSPQSIVLERLRETLISPESPHFKHLNDGIQSQQPHTNPVPPSQSASVQGSKAMPAQKGQGKAGQSSILKQTDIGVFFGLKPLREKEKEAQSGPAEPSKASVPALGDNSRRGGDGARRSAADAPVDTSRGTAGGGGGGVRSGRGTARGGWSRGWSGRSRVNADGEVQFQRCPFYKKIPGTKFVIDAFQYGAIEGIAAYFLTHFHSDHYGGLTKKSTLPIYCNRITGNLVKSKLKVAEQYVHILPMNTQVTVEGVGVTLVDANHCPGAAMLLFFLPDGQIVLHTGDFRADPSMESYPELLSCRVQTLYLDTTYCSPEHTFPRQQEVINFAASTAFELVTLNPRTLVVCGSYSVGKEKVFLALAEVLGSKVCLSKDKYITMCCLESEQVRRHITTDWKAAQVHVLPMMQLSFNNLRHHLARFSDRYDQLVAFKPTGWTFSHQVESVEDIRPQISGNISIYGVPYSEHSSYLELKRFVQWIRPLKIIPTVNNGRSDNRRAMETCFGEWLTEARAGF